MKKLLVCFLVVLALPNTKAWTQVDTTQYNKYRFGGYGEMLYQFMDYSADRYNNPEGAQAENRAQLDIPRAVFAFDYRFRNDISLSTELEIEHGGTGSALELEYEEAGEYEAEIEKAGEVVLEQFFILKKLNSRLSLKVGHFSVPVGRLNTYHIPTEYFTASRTEGEQQIIPSTWHETGLALLGQSGNWAYELQLVNGLDANGFTSANWISGGHQRIFETTKASNMALVARVDNQSVPNLRWSFSGYLGSSAGNTSKAQKMDGISGKVSIVAFDGEYNNRRFIFRWNALWGHLSDSYQITVINQTLSKNIQYPRTPVAEQALSYSTEIGYDVLTHFRSRARLIPFVRYEYYNSMEATANGIFADARYKRQLITGGINYYIAPQIAIKADYTHRIIDGGNYNSENTFSISVVYATFFIKK